jgi:hypothetical protein
VKDGDEGGEGCNTATKIKLFPHNLKILKRFYFVRLVQKERDE